MIFEQLLGNRPTVQFFELGLGIKKINVRRTTRHKEENDALRFWSMMEAGQILMLGQKLVIHQGGQSHRAQAPKRAA